jgi:hypothetical protein
MEEDLLLVINVVKKQHVPIWDTAFVPSSSQFPEIFLDGLRIHKIPIRFFFRGGVSRKLRTGGVNFSPPVPNILFKARPEGVFFLLVKCLPHPKSTSPCTLSLPTGRQA